MKTNNVNIKFDKSIGIEKAQLIFDGDIIVPDSQPDIENILEVLVNPVIEKAEAGDGRVNYRGSIYTDILYLSKGESRDVHSMNGVIPINDFISVDGANDGMICDIILQISGTAENIVNERKVNCKIFADACVSVKQAFETECIKEITDIPSEQQKCRQAKLCSTVINSAEDFTVNESIELSNSKPNIDRILQVDSKISHKDIRVFNDKVDISGEIAVNILYKGEDESNPIEIQEGKIDFNGSIPFDSLYDDVYCDVCLSISSCKYSVVEDNDGESRIISVNIEMSADINAVEQYTVDILEDAYCLNKHIDIQTVSVACNMPVCKNNSQFPIKEIVETDDESPDMLRVYKVSGMSYVDRVTTVDDKLLVDGVINMNILYVTDIDETPAYGARVAIPFSQTIEAKGTRENMDVCINQYISNIRFNMLSDREIEIRCMLNIDATVTNTVEEEFAVSAEMSDMDKEDIKNFPAIVIYFVRPGDTLWKLSKRFNSTVQSIAKINNIENPDLIYPNQKLIIVKSDGCTD